MSIESPEKSVIARLRIGDETEHIELNSESLCGETESDSSVRIVPSDVDPIADASVNICPDCIDEWVEIAPVDREKTVKCHSTRVEDDEMYVCGNTVLASKAVALDHDSADQLLPVCPSCYHWIVSVDENPLSEPIEEMVRWDEVTDESLITL